MEVCKNCGGEGFTAEHDSPDLHGLFGECVNCPVAVPCRECNATGTTGKKLFNKEQSVDEVEKILIEEFNTIEKHGT